MPILSMDEVTVKRLRDDGGGRQRNKAVCLDCAWRYEYETGHAARAHGEAHRYETHHTVELRCDILDVFIDRLVPRSPGA